MKGFTSAPLMKPEDIQRRSFLKAGAAAAGLGLLLGSADLKAAVLPAARRQVLHQDQTIQIYNMATGETLKTTFWAEGKVVPESMRAIDHIMRDHHTNQADAMDPKLIILLHSLSSAVAARQPIHLVSGYRCPKTNAHLHHHSHQVAKHSMHMYGKAADIFIPGRPLSNVHQAAMHLRAGGVGYYPRDNWVHVDTGAIAYWTGGKKI